MKKITTILIVLSFIAIFATPLFAGENEVKQAVNSYIEAVNKRDQGTLNSLIVNGAKFCWVNKIINKNEEGDKNTFVKNVSEGKIGGWGKDIAIKSINDQDKIAVAYVEISSAKLMQREYISLVNVNGKWMVVSSVFSIEKL